MFTWDTNRRQPSRWEFICESTNKIPATGKKGGTYFFLSIEWGGQAGWQLISMARHKHQYNRMQDITFRGRKRGATSLNVLFHLSEWTIKKHSGGVTRACVVGVTANTEEISAAQERCKFVKHLEICPFSYMLEVGLTVGLFWFKKNWSKQISLYGLLKSQAENTAVIEQDETFRKG